jgi:hypothetical protein
LPRSCPSLASSNRLESSRPHLSLSYIGLSHLILCSCLASFFGVISSCVVLSPVSSHLASSCVMSCILLSHDPTLSGIVAALQCSEVRAKGRARSLCKQKQSSRVRLIYVPRRRRPLALVRTSALAEDSVSPTLLSLGLIFIRILALLLSVTQT